MSIVSSSKASKPVFRQVESFINSDSGLTILISVRQEWCELKQKGAGEGGLKEVLCTLSCVSLSTFLISFFFLTGWRYKCSSSLLTLGTKYSLLNVSQRQRLLSSSICFSRACTCIVHSRAHQQVWLPDHFQFGCYEHAIPDYMSSTESRRGVLQTFLRNASGAEPAVELKHGRCHVENTWVPFCSWNISARIMLRNLNFFGVNFDCSSQGASWRL